MSLPLLPELLDLLLASLVFVGLLLYYWVLNLGPCTW